jgi:hypothetical protein
MQILMPKDPTLELKQTVLFSQFIKHSLRPKQLAIKLTKTYVSESKPTNNQIDD